MPAIQQGQPYQLANRCWGIRYYDPTSGKRARATEGGAGFSSPSAAKKWLREFLEAVRRGEHRTSTYTLAEFVPVYLARHQGRQRTIATLRERLRHATATFGDVPLRELEALTDEIAGWQATLPERSRYGIVQALRQTLEAAVRWQHMNRNPAKLAGRNSQPTPRAVRVFSPAELNTIASELSEIYRPLPPFVAATGLRPEEWGALERRDVDRRAGVLNVVRTSPAASKDDPRTVVELGKTNVSRRQVPLSPRALAALDALPPRLHTPLLFPAPEGGLFNIDNFRRREWGPAIEAGGVRLPRGSMTCVRPTPRTACSSDRDLRAGADHGDLGTHDRASLRGAAHWRRGEHR